MTDTIPLFPLNLVLFPGARLPLRIFESRYIDMVRECMRYDSGFGVVWRLDGDAASAGGHARIGTEARIVDFSTLEDGLLGIECRGERRFLVRSTRCRDNGLLMAEVDWIHDQAAGPVASRHGALQSLMREILAHKALSGQVEADAEDAASLGFGLASILPIDRPRAQGLLESTEPEQRLDTLVELIEGMADAETAGNA
ncbi:MAG: LON peptidase substrate-binding domain-containing protein [Pseudomonadota bacterium]